MKSFSLKVVIKLFLQLFYQ